MQYLYKKYKVMVFINVKKEQIEIKKINVLLKKAEYLNTCNNFIGAEPTPYLLDIDNRENGKQVQWSHLYTIMTFNNITNGKKNKMNNY